LSPGAASTEAAARSVKSIATTKAIRICTSLGEWFATLEVIKNAAGDAPP
jgi:hypothetical protein